VATNKPYVIVARQALNQDELAEVRWLQDVCNAYDGLDLKLSVAVARQSVDESGEGANQFLAYLTGVLVGYCSLDVGGSVEVCGMVHPVVRREGIGRKLLAAATQERRRQGVRRVLLICEDASRAGKAFVTAAGARWEFAEHRMELDASRRVPVSGASGQSIVLRRAGPEDVGTLARVQAGVFGDPEDAVRRSIQEDTAAAEDRFYLGLLGDEPVSSLKVIFVDSRAAIYAFGVLPQYRGRGLGRQMFVRLFETLRPEGWMRFMLEVEPDNAAALALYQGLGFRMTTTYGYYQLDL
jgi:ribosomal protein S18 acetylase RimI-like enzyme